jgi:predicted RNA-binding protein with TRAM domain
MVELVEVDRHDGAAAVAKVDGIDVCVGEAAELVGKKVKVKVERVFDGLAYASLVRRATKKPVEPLTAEGEAEKPTRKPPARKADAATDADLVEDEIQIEDEEELDIEDEEPGAVEPEVVAVDGDGPASAPVAKKKTRRGTRGGKNRKKKPGAATATDGDEGPIDEALPAPTDDALTPAPKPARTPKTATIHLPPDDLGEEGEMSSANGDTSAPARKKTRRGSRGGKNRRKREAAVAADASAPEPMDSIPEPAATPEPEQEPEEKTENFDYVPMSQWGDEFE